MPSCFSSARIRIGAMVSLVGVALIVLGFFLPLTGNPDNVVFYEWTAVYAASYYLTLCFGFLVALLAALPFLGMLIVVGTSLVGLFGVHSPRLVLLQRVAAGGGLAIQLLLDLLVFLNLVYGTPDIAWGFVVVLLGFIITVIGAFVGKTHQSHERATHS